LIWPSSTFKKSSWVVKQTKEYQKCLLSLLNVVTVWIAAEVPEG